MNLESPVAETELAVRAAVARWARGTHSLLGRALPDAIIRVDDRALEWREAEFLVRTRRIARRTAPLPRAVRERQAHFDPTQFDAWEPAIESKLAGFRRVVTCLKCDGNKQIQCMVCKGTVSRTCDVCHGSGNDISPKTGRVIRCRSCRGSGMRRCECRDGIVQCDECVGKGCTHEWLEATEHTHSERVSATPSPDLPISEPNEANGPQRVVSWSGTPHSATDQRVRAVERELASRLSLNFAEDRVEQVSIFISRGVVSTVEFELARTPGSVHVQSWDSKVLPTSTALDPFRAARRRIVAGITLSFFAAAVLASWYSSRHLFFMFSSNAAFLWMTNLVLPLTLIGPLVYSTRPGRVRRIGASVALILPALLVTAGQVMMATTGGPSIGHAKQLASTFQEDLAISELTAAVDLYDDDDAKRLHDHLQIQRFARLKSSASAWSGLPEFPVYSDVAHSDLQQHALGLALEESATYQRRGDFGASKGVLITLPVAFRNHPTVRRLRAIALRSDAELAWSRVTATAASLSRRVSACGDIEKRISAAVSEGVDRRELPSGLLVSGTCSQLQKQLRLAEEREQAAERAAQLREARAERVRVALEAARERQWTTAPLQCRDGTSSPSCVCGGSHRGCCSHHGGVAGCSQ
jgi:hypothetical protein